MQHAKGKVPFKQFVMQVFLLFKQSELLPNSLLYT